MRLEGIFGTVAQPELDSIGEALFFGLLPSFTESLLREIDAGRLAGTLLYELPDQVPRSASNFEDRSSGQPLLRDSADQLSSGLAGKAIIELALARRLAAIEESSDLFFVHAGESIEAFSGGSELGRLAVAFGKP